MDAYPGNFQSQAPGLAERDLRGWGQFLPMAPVCETLYPPALALRGSFRKGHQLVGFTHGYPLIVPWGLKQPTSGGCQKIFAAPTSRPLANPKESG